MDNTEIVKKELSQRLERFYERLERAAIASGRTKNDIKIVAAVKTHPPEIINALYELGIREVGENRADEVTAKAPFLNQEIKVHFIGRLQSNKVKYIINKVRMVQSLDRLSLAQELDKRARANGFVMPALVEVNMGCEEQKGGVMPPHARDFIAQVLDNYPNIAVQGVMCVMPIGAQKDLYRQAAQLYGILCKEYNLKWLSMGMTDDFEVAVECGANMIRPGRVILGERAKV